MNFHLGDVVFQLLTFLMAIAVHESAHALIAYRCGDPTAKMLGRITLNPLKHIDPIGTVLLPVIGLVTGAGIFGWAKPCPVTPGNFRRPVRDDILTTIAGPLSNLILVAVATFLLAVICMVTGDGRDIVHSLAYGDYIETDSIVLPLVWFFYTMVSMNMLLCIFNLLPIPPLDGSHVLRHALPESLRGIYDNVGMIGFILLFTVGGRIIGPLVGEAMHVMDTILLAF
jgi:Zn-dependent protease